MSIVFHQWQGFSLEYKSVAKDEKKDKSHRVKDDQGDLQKLFVFKLAGCLCVNRTCPPHDKNAAAGLLQADASELSSVGSSKILKETQQ